MNCPGCNSSNWEYPDVSIARCKNCGYLLDTNVFRTKDNSSQKPTGSQRSKNSKRSAIIAVLVAILLYAVSIWIPDWAGLWVIGMVASGILFLDHLMYL
jgi:hypothetical protein